MIQTLKTSVPSQVEKPPIPSSYGEGKVCSALRYLIYTLCRAPHWLLGSQKLPKRCLRTVIQKCGLTAIPSVNNRKALGVCRARAQDQDSPLGKEGSPNKKELPWASATPQRSPSMLFLLSPVCFCSFSLSNSRGARPGLYRVRGDTPFHGEPSTGLEQHSENMGLGQMGASLETVCQLFMIKDSTGRVAIQSRAGPAYPASFF